MFAHSRCLAKRLNIEENHITLKLIFWKNLHMTRLINSQGKWRRTVASHGCRANALSTFHALRRRDDRNHVDRGRVDTKVRDETGQRCVVLILAHMWLPAPAPARQPRAPPKGQHGTLCPYQRQAGGSGATDLSCNHARTRPHSTKCKTQSPPDGRTPAIVTTCSKLPVTTTTRG